MTFARMEINHILGASHQYKIDAIEHFVRSYPYVAQTLLTAEYRNPNGPRYTLIQWLKRHRLHNPTVRTIHKP